MIGNVPGETETKAEFFERFAVICDQLRGHGFSLNGLPIETVIRDIRKPLPTHLVVDETRNIIFWDLASVIDY